MKRSGIGFPIHLDAGPFESGCNVVGFDCQYAIQRSFVFGVAAQMSVTQSDLLQRPHVARIQINRALEAVCRLFPASLSSVNVTCQSRYLLIVRQTTASDFQFNEGAIVIEVPPMEIPRTSEVCFASFGTKMRCLFDGRFG